MILRCVAFVAVLTAAGLFAAFARGEVIAQYTFTGQATGNGQDAASGQAIPETVNSSFLSAATAISTPDNTPETGVRLQYRNSAANFANLPGANAAFPTLEGRVTSPAPDTNKYFTFSLTANAGFDLSTLAFDMAEGATNVNDSRGAQVLMSLDNFGTSNIDLGTRMVTDPAIPSDNYEHFMLDLLNTPVSAGQTVSFRFLPFVTTGAAGGVRFDNITINEGIATAVVGDYNANSVVDAADYVTWRDMFGQTGTGLAADGKGPGGTPDGVVDALDYDFWKARFGNTSGSGSAAGSLVPGSIPEPSAMVLVLWAIAGLVGRCNRARQRRASESRVTFC